MIEGLVIRRRILFPLTLDGYVHTYVLVTMDMYSVLRADIDKDLGIIIRLNTP